MRPVALKCLLATVACVLWISVASAALAQSAAEEFFPGDIFELRPPHVRTSLLGESEENPRSYRHFPFFETPPAVPPQDEIRLTNQDFVTLVYPAHRGSFHSGGRMLLDRLRVGEYAIELDLFHIPLPWTGQTVAAPSERGIFVRRLPAGEYDVTIHNWYLSPDVSPGFDPEAFEPPPNVIMVTTGVIGLPRNVDEAPIVAQSSFRFNVIAVPESCSIVLAAFAALCIAASSRFRSRRLASWGV